MIQEQIIAQPLYEIVANRLREMAAGRKPGERFHSEREIAARFGVSVVTVRSSLATLCQEGVLNRRHGSGTFVSAPDRVSTGLVAILATSSPTDDFYMELLGSLTQALQAQRHGVLLTQCASLSPIPPEEIERVDGLIDRKPDALVVQGSGLILCERLLARRDDIRNLIIFDGGNVPASLAAHRVDFDRELATHLTTSHLLNAGRRRLAFLSAGQFGFPGVHAAYKRGILRAMGEHGMSENDGVWFKVPPEKSATTSQIDSWLRQILERPDRPDGIVCMWDHLGLLAVRAAKRLGLRVPEDVMVTGLYDTPWSVACDPSLTTVHFDTQAMARTIAERLDRTDHFDTVMIAPELIVKESTGGVSEADEGLWDGICNEQRKE